MKKYMRAFRRAWRTFKISAFGEYQINIWNGEFDTAVYKYKGTEYPLISLDREAAE